MPSTRSTTLAVGHAIGSQGYRPESPFVTAAEAIEELARGRFLVVADGEHPGSQADVMIAAEFASAEAVNFLAAEARGVVYLGLSDDRCRELDLWPMTGGTVSESWKSAFTVTIDAREGITTGISAADRARTVAVAIDQAGCATDLVRPGHIAPLRAQPGGLMTRAGRTEAFTDLPRMAGLAPAGVASCVMTDEGALASVADLVPWCERHDIKMVTVEAAAMEAVRRLPWLERRAERVLRTAHGDVDAVFFAGPCSDVEHVAVVGDLSGPGAARVAVVGHCAAGHVFGDGACAQRSAVDDALRAVAAGHADVLLYVGLPGLCCRDGAPEAEQDFCAGAARPLSEMAWAVVAKTLHELGVMAMEEVNRT